MLIYSTNTRKCPIWCWFFFHPTFIPRYRETAIYSVFFSILAHSERGNPEGISDGGSGEANDGKGKGGGGGEANGGERKR